MKTLPIACLTLAAFLGTSLETSPGLSAFEPAPQERAGQVSEVPKHFRAMLPLIGKRWVGTFPGGQHQDFQEFEWMLGGKFIRNVHQLKTLDGKLVYEGETIYGWDHEAERLRWWYFNATGGQIIGEVNELDGRLVAEGKNHAPKGQTPRVRSEMIVEDGVWTMISYHEVGGEWQEEFEVEFRPLP